MYLKGNDLGEALTNFLPANQFGRLGVYLAICSVLFALEFLIFYLIRKQKNKKIEQITTE